MSLRKTVNKLETTTMEMFQGQNTKIHFQWISTVLFLSVKILGNTDGIWRPFFMTSSDTNITPLISGLTWLTWNITCKHPQAHVQK